jgi:hypothetical protein
VRDADTTRLGDRLQTGGDIHTFAMSVFALDNHIAEIDPDADMYTLFLGKRTVPFIHLTLDGDGALNCINDTCEFREDAIARQFEDAPAVLFDYRLEYFLAMSLQSGERASLVALHQRRIAGNVGDQNGGKASFHGHLPLTCLVKR